MALSAECGSVVLFLIVMAREAGLAHGNLPRMRHMAGGAAAIKVTAYLMQFAKFLVA